MHFHSTKLGMTLLASLVLAACGSSGGGSSSPMQANPVPAQPAPSQPMPAQPTPSQPMPSQPEAQTMPPVTVPQAGKNEEQNANPPMVSQPSSPQLMTPSEENATPENRDERYQAGNSRIISGYRLPERNIPLPFRSVDQNADITQVQLDGKTIQLLSKEQAAPLSSLRESGNLTALQGAFGDNTRWAWFAPKEGEKGYLLTVAKNPTTKAEMPQGYATYNGTGVHITHQGQVAPTSVKFEVDFDQKTLKGSISPMVGQENFLPNQAPIQLEAQISGNTFEGEVNNVQTAGGFYGKDAGEMLGTYSHFENPEESYYFGAFGAKKP